MSGGTDHVQGTGLLGEEVIGGIVGSGSLRNLLVRLRFQGVDHVGELHSILDEEDGQVDANDVQVTCVSVEARCESSNVSGSISASVMGVSRWRFALIY